MANGTFKILEDDKTIISFFLEGLDFLSLTKKNQTPKRHCKKLKMTTPQNWATKIPQDICLWKDYLQSLYFNYSKISYLHKEWE